jgi:hypothetical protein
MYFLKFIGAGLGVMVFNVNFNYISAISWRSVLLVEETRVPGENHRSVKSLSSYKFYQVQYIYINCLVKMSRACKKSVLIKHKKKRVHPVKIQFST